MLPFKDNWLCHICSEKNSDFRFRCKTCSDYDRCLYCLNIAHSHHLVLQNLNEVTKKSNTEVLWLCNGCSKKNESIRFRCIDSSCDFDYCLNCYLQKEHEHSLRYLYGTSKWKCNGCSTSDYNFIFESKYRFKCTVCDNFDYCFQCMNQKGHEHPMKIIQGFQRWGCDICKIINATHRFRCNTCEDFDLCENCYVKQVHFQHTFRMLHGISIYSCNLCGKKNDPKRYRCGICNDYDLCETCFKKSGHKHSMNPFILDQVLSPQTIDSPILSPALSSLTSSSIEEGDECCIVCMDKEKNGIIIHGDTSHQACCYECAKKLFTQNKECPICRAHIQLVVKNFKA